MDQNRFEKELEGMGLGAYGIGRREDGGYSIHVQGVNFIATGSDPFALFQEMIDHLQAPKEAKEPSTCNAVTAGLTTITDKLLEFFGDADAVYAFTEAICGPQLEPLRTSDVETARKVNQGAIVSVFKEVMTQAFDNEFNESPENEEMSENEANLHRTVQEAFENEAPKRMSLEELSKLSPEDLEGRLEASLDGIAKILGQDKLDEIRRNIVGAMGIPAHMLGENRDGPTATDGMVKEPAPVRARNMAAKFPRVVEGMSGLVYLLFGESGELTSSYDCYVLGHKSREDAEYKNEIGIVEKNRIVKNYDRDLSHQMNTRLHDALKAYAIYK